MPKSAAQELEGTNLDCAMAQHLLVAADRFQLHRLRRICERRLCETVEVSPAASSAASVGCLCFVPVALLRAPLWGVRVSPVVVGTLKVPLSLSLC